MIPFGVGLRQRGYKIMQVKEDKESEGYHVIW
jgi:hypothetical protein